MLAAVLLATPCVSVALQSTFVAFAGQDELATASPVANPQHSSPVFALSCAAAPRAVSATPIRLTMVQETLMASSGSPDLKKRRRRPRQKVVSNSEPVVLQYYASTYKVTFNLTLEYL